MNKLIFLLITILHFHNSSAFSFESIMVDSISNSPPNTEQQQQPIIKRMQLQFLAGVGYYDFPDFNSDYLIDGLKPSYRPGFSIACFPKFVPNKHLFFEPGIHVTNFAGTYQELNTEGQPLSSMEELSWTKVMLNIGIGAGYRTVIAVLSARIGLTGDFSVTTRKTFISDDYFYSFGIGGDASAQIDFLVTKSIGIPIRIGYGYSFSTEVARFITIWDKHWYDYIAQKNKTQKCNGSYLMAGIIYYFGKAFY